MLRGSAASQEQMGTGGWGLWRGLLSLAVQCVRGSTAPRASEEQATPAGKHGGHLLLSKCRAYSRVAVGTDWDRPTPTCT